MRYFQISSGFRIPISVEEQELITKCGNSALVASELDERTGQLAHEMTVRGLLRRIDSDDGSYYETDQMDLWRF